MDLDNINDIEVLRDLAKKNMVKMKKDAHANDGTSYLFKENHWYYVEQDQFSVTIYSDDFKSECCFSYDDANRYLFKQ